MEKVKMEFDTRVFELLSKDLYRDDLAFLRELTQNSYDAGATEIVWNLGYDYIEEVENGRGMSYDFLVNDFKMIGKPFKRGDELGFYGIGRLSVWRVASKVEIFTRDSHLVWEDIPYYYIERTTNYTDGLRMRIYLKDQKSLYLSQIVNYLKSNCILPIKIRVMDTAFDEEVIVEPEISGLPSIEVSDYRVWVSNSSNWGIFVYEKGLLVKNIFSGEGTIYIDYARQIKTLSREQLIVPDGCVFTDVAIALSKMIDRGIIGEDYSRITSYIAYRTESKDLASKVILKGKSLSDYKKEGYYVAKNQSPLSDKAVTRGFNILIVDDEFIYNCATMIGMPIVSELKHIIKDEILHFGASKDTEEVLIDCSRYLEYLTRIVDRVESNINIPKSQVVLVQNKIKETLEFPEVSLVEEKGSRDILFSMGIVCLGISDDPNTVAWNIGDKIALNLANDFIKTVLEHKRLDLLEEVLTHEFVHRLGYSYHGETFNSVYNTLRLQALRDKARFSNPNNSNSKPFIKDIP